MNNAGFRDGRRLAAGVEVAGLVVAFCLVALMSMARPASADTATLHVAAIGGGLNGAVTAWKAAGIDAFDIATRDCPTDPALIAQRANVLVVTPQGLNKAQQQAIEAFVRGGGGLLIDSSGQRQRWRGTMLDTLSPTVGLDNASVHDAKAAPALPDSPFVDAHAPDLSGMPRWNNAQDVSTPDFTDLQMLNTLSAYTFSKPPWSDRWRTWAVTSDPLHLAVVSSARYGAGRTAAWGAGSIADARNIAWTGYIGATRVLLDWLCQAGPSVPSPSPTFSMSGFTPPAWWDKPLEAGMSGMGSNVPAGSFDLAPEALEEAGYAQVGAGASVQLLFGDQANASPDPAAKIVVRIPAGSGAGGNLPFDPRKLVRIAGVTGINQLVNGKSQPVTFPIDLPEETDGLPTLPSTDSADGLMTMPSSWKVALTQDSDSKIDIAQGWFAKSYADSGWTDHGIAPMTAKLWGKTVGYDGAIWYRGTVTVNPSPPSNAVLQADADAQIVTVYVDGRQWDTEPKTAEVSLSALDAGPHQVAVRTYGELRSNKGLKFLGPVLLPLLWHPDSDHVGLTQGFNNAVIDETKWQPVHYDYGKDPAGAESLEGWVRSSITVPDGAHPYFVSLNVQLNAESAVYVDGKLVGRQGFHRVSSYVIPQSAFHAGRNSIAVWTRYLNLESHGISLSVHPADTLIFTATVNSPADGLGLRLPVSNSGPYGSAPLGGVILDDGVVVGGVSPVDNGAALYAAHALHSGVNNITIRIKRFGGALTIGSLDIVKAPANEALTVPGWVRLPRTNATAQWCVPALDDSGWEPVDEKIIQDWQKIWVLGPAADLGDPNFVYRTHLRLSSDDLRSPLTLFLKAPVIKTIFVNGQPIAPDDESYYSLNSALKAGDNVIAFAPDGSTYRGLDLSTPSSTLEGDVAIPQLRTDRAPLIPTVKNLVAYRLNRTFPVSALTVPAGATVLFAWPDGSPAIASAQVGGHSEILAAPGIFDDLLPAPNINIEAKQSGSASSIEYDYAARIQRDGFDGDRIDQLIPALIASVKPDSPSFATMGKQDPEHVAVTLAGAVGAAKLRIVWRWLDFEGRILGSGEQEVTDSVAIPIPMQPDSPSSTFGRSYRLRAALLSDDRRQVYAFLDRHIDRSAPVSLALRFDSKLTRRTATTETIIRRAMNQSLEGLDDSFVYTPGEVVHATLTAVLRADSATTERSVVITATPQISGSPISSTQKVTLIRGVPTSITMAIPADATSVTQPWMVTATMAPDGFVASASFVVAKPEGEIKDYDVESHEGRGVGGYMWQMTPHAWPIEHLTGADATPVPNGGEWWTRVRQGGDGNWLVAEGIHRGGGDGDQDGLLWGPFYDETRGEIGDSYGWFPNGQSVREWWGPYAVRELARKSGDRSVTFYTSDWWQYDAGVPPESYATIEMFDNWLATNAGKKIAGVVVDGKPVPGSTLGEALGQLRGAYASLFKYFQAQGLARSAQYTSSLLDAVSPGTNQQGQGGFAGWLPSTIGGTALGPEWTAAEHSGTIDMDNHPFAGDWQYSIETSVYRALGDDNDLFTGWESPQRYHRVDDSGTECVPLDAVEWTRRLLDSRWMVAAGGDGHFSRTLDVTHQEDYTSDHFLLSHASDPYDLDNEPNAHIGNGELPYHWEIKDKLANLAMTVAPAKPLSPLLLVGDSDLGWFDYYAILGELKNTGMQIGGAITLSQLGKFQAADIPGLIWMPARLVDDADLLAVVDKVKAGVPLFLIGNIPRSSSLDLGQMLGVTHIDEDTPPIGGAQTVPAAFQSLPEAAAVADEPDQAPEPPYKSVDGALMQPMILREDRMVAGVIAPTSSAGAGMKVVFCGAVTSPWLRDPAVQEMVVKAFNKLVNPVVTYSDGAGGYTFRDTDGRLFAVVENLTERPATVRLGSAQLFTSATIAVDMLAGTRLHRTDGDPGSFDVVLPGAGGTVVQISETHP